MSPPTRARNEPAVKAAIFVAFALLLIFVAYPIARVLLASVLRDGRWTLETYRDLIGSNVVAVPLWNSLRLGATVAVIGTVVGYGAAYAIVMAAIPLRRTLRFVLLLPMVAPPFMLALAAIMLLGRNGLITRNVLIPMFGAGAAPDIYGFWGLVLVQTLTYLPTSVLLLAAALAAIDPSLEEAANSHGASHGAVFRHVVLPLSVPAILSSLLLLFLESLADFGNPLILGGDFRVLSVAAFLKITGEFDTAGGAVLAALLLVPALIAFAAQRHYVARTSFATLSGRPGSATRIRAHAGARSALLIGCGAIALTTLAFYGAVLYGSLVEVWGVTTELTLSHYGAALRGSRGALADSLLLAAIATPITALLGVAIAWLVVRRQFPARTAMSALAISGLAVPGTVVGIGYILAFNRPPLLLTGTAAIIVLLFVFRSLPVAFEAGAAAIRQVDLSIEEGSASLGAAPATTLRLVVLPIIAPAMFTALAHSFVRSLTAISAVIFVVSGTWQLLTVSILGFVENSDLSRASALCMLLVLVVSLTLLLLQLALGRRDVHA